MNKVIRPAWANLKFGEWLRAVLCTKCLTCQAGPMEPCTDKKGNSLTTPHEWRNLQAQRDWEHERANEMAGVDDEDDIQAAEAARRCPWCGTLFDTVILMEEHEVCCE